MFIFGLYTVLVWWAAFRHRRTFQGLFLVCAGAGGLFLISELVTLAFPTAEGGPSTLVAVLLLPYCGLLLLGGIYIVALPKPKRVLTCGACAYDMQGLDDGARCPECGRDDAAVRPARGTASAPPESPDDAEHENADGKPGEQRPVDPRATAA